MTKEEKILVLEENYRSIFKREFIPRYLIVKANRIIEEWKYLTNWKEDNSYPLTVVLTKEILDKIPPYQIKEKEIFIKVKRDFS